MNYTSVSVCGNDHSEWVRALDFYKDDIRTLEKRLLEMAAKNNGHEAMASVEHFQNQFIVQRNNIDELRHSVNEHAGQVASEARAHAGKMEDRHTAEHDQLKEQFSSFEKVFNDLRHEFNSFLTRWM